jgi:hypothetical protein
VSERETPRSPMTRISVFRRSFSSETGLQSAHVVQLNTY